MSAGTLLYLVGAPGVGKTTLMAELTASCERQQHDKPFAHDTLHHGPRVVGMELGRRRDTFSGTDALAMSVQPLAIEWITGRIPGYQPHRLVLAEGARLATTGFLHAARAAGYRVILVHLDAPDATLDGRRADRGSDQNPAWMRGAATRARKIADRMELDATVRRLTADKPPAALARQIAALSPDLEELCSI